LGHWAFAGKQVLLSRLVRPNKRPPTEPKSLRGHFGSVFLWNDALPKRSDLSSTIAVDLGSSSLVERRFGMKSPHPVLDNARLPGDNEIVGA